MAVPRKKSASNPAIGPVRRFGRYTLVKKLATGGMAEIWLARQRGLAGFNRFVVIKKILGHLSEQETFVRMFLDEARTSAQLNHPNVVQIYDLGKEGESYYIAMEFIAGENLAAIAWRGMKRGNPFPPPYAARVIADGCKALHYAHHLKGSDGMALEIVHRDISPQNILVTYEGEVKVVDFGIAKAATKSEVTKTGMLKGKFSYMSPEQCLGAPVDMRSDVFALGILLYELCTGKRLFKHESELMILEMITKRSVVPPSQVAPGISPRLEDIVMRALEKDVSTRFQTAQEMQIALEEYLRDEDDQAPNADIAGYMRKLFVDKIEEKRRLREIASRDDFEAMFGGSEEATEADASRRRVVQGLSPQQVQVRAATAPLGAQGSLPGTPYPQGSIPGTPLPPGYPMQASGSHAAMYPPGYAHPSQYSGVVQEPAGGSWIARAVIIGALAVILVASGILYRQCGPPPEFGSNPTTGEPPKPGKILSGKLGKLELDSKPKGATIYLDGKQMLLENGKTATTPSDLHSLQYGVKYNIRLELNGHKPYETTVELGKNTDGAKLEPQLEAFPGTFIAEVSGDSRGDVRIFIDGEDVGLGPRITRSVPGLSTVIVRAELAGHRCKAVPARVRVAPNQTRKSTITCRKRGRIVRPPPAPPGGGTDRRQPPPVKPRPDKGCGSDCCEHPSMEGWVTIATTPVSRVFWKGRDIGETPLHKIRVPAGCVKLKVVYEIGGEKKEKWLPLKVKPNAMNKFPIKLR